MLMNIRQMKGMMLRNTTEETMVMVEYKGDSLNCVGSTVTYSHSGRLIVLSSKNLGKLKRNVKRRISVSNM